MSDACLDRAWRMDKRVNLGALVSLACSLCVVIGLVTGLNVRLGVVENKLSGMETREEKRVEAWRDTAIKVERIEERILGVQRTLGEIRDELKAGREAR